MKTTIILVRHGQTEWNSVRRLQGISDIPLSELGHVQAERLGRKLSIFRITKIYSSKLIRAIQTAEAIALHHELPIIHHEGFNERAYGQWEGEFFEELDRKFNFSQNPFSLHTIPDGEPYEVFKERVISTFDHTVSQNHGETIVVVCHSGVLRVITRELQARFPHLAKRVFEFPNTSYHIFHLDKDAIVEEIIEKDERVYSK